MTIKKGYMTIKIAFVHKSKGYKRDFTIIQRVHCDCKEYCTLHKKHRENAEVQSTSLNWAPVNRDCRKWVGCEAIAPIQVNVHFLTVILSCMGAKASQPIHFLQSQLTRA